MDLHGGFSFITMTQELTVINIGEYIVKESLDRIMLSLYHDVMRKPILESVAVWNGSCPEYTISAFLTSIASCRVALGSAFFKYQINIRYETSAG